MSPHLSSSHLFPSLLTCHPSKTVFISFERWESSSQLISALLQARKLLLLEKKSFVQKRLCTESFCTQKLWDTDPFAQKKHIDKIWQNTLYYKACTKHVPVLLCNTKLAQSTSKYYFVIQSLHKVRPSSALYYKACTKHVPVLLCNSKLALSTSQYYFVIQSLRSVRPSTTLYYKACTKYVQVLLCTTKLAQSTSQYYFVLQSPSPTLYYKACIKYFPVLLPSLHKISCQIIFRFTMRFTMQPFPFDSRCPAAKDTSITHAAMAPQATLTQPLQSDLHRLRCKTQ